MVGKRCMLVTKSFEGWSLFCEHVHAAAGDGISKKVHFYLHVKNP